MRPVGAKSLLLLLLTSLLAAGLTGPASRAASPSEVATRIVELTNEARQTQGVGPLETMPYLTEAALQHSDEMLKLQYFSHTSPTAGMAKPSDRIRAAGGKELACAENIYQCQGFSIDEVAALAMKALLRSPTHYKNLMNSAYNRIGVGVATNGNAYYITQVFSYLAVHVENVQVNPAGGGYSVNLSGTVVEGATEGGIFYDGRKVSAWTAGPDKRFSTSFDIPGKGVLQVGQRADGNRYSIDVEFSVPQP